MLALLKFERQQDRLGAGPTFRASERLMPAAGAAPDRVRRKLLRFEGPPGFGPVSSPPEEQNKLGGQLAHFMSMISCGNANRERVPLFAVASAKLWEIADVVAPFKAKEADEHRGPSEKRAAALMLEPGEFMARLPASPRAISAIMAGEHQSAAYL